MHRSVRPSRDLCKVVSWRRSVAAADAGTVLGAVVTLGGLLAAGRAASATHCWRPWRTVIAQHRGSEPGDQAGEGQQVPLRLENRIASRNTAQTIQQGRIAPAPIASSATAAGPSLGSSRNRWTSSRRTAAPAPALATLARTTRSSRGMRSAWHDQTTGKSTARRSRADGT